MSPRAARSFLAVVASGVVSFGLGVAGGCKPEVDSLAGDEHAGPDGSPRRGPALTESPPSNALPELMVPRLRAEDALAVDGVIDEPAWRRAAKTGEFVDAQTGMPARRGVGGSARLLWDDAALYVAFTVRDDDVRGGFSTEAVDPHLWTRDTVELMIDPDGDGDGLDYYEIQVNPQNLVFDSRFDSYNQPRGGPDGPFGHEEWSSRVTSAVTIDGSLDDALPDRGYQVEMRLPWSSLSGAKRAPPEPGDTWRLNLYAMQDNGGVSWSPILGQGNFHRASRFGRVHWSD